MDGTILCQGSFTSNFVGLANPNPGNAEIANSNAMVVAIPSNADWMNVYNYTAFGRVGNAGTAYFNGAATASVGVQFYWQRGMAPGTGIVKYYGAASQVIDGDTLVSGGFTLWDPSGQSAANGALPVIGNAIATTASTNVTRPVVSTGNTAGLSVGSIVRMSNTAQTDVNGIDMVVGAVTAGVSFTLLTATNALATAPGAIGGAGFYRIINYNPLFYPRYRYITNITQAVNAQVSTSVPHEYCAGQAVRFEIPQVSGMTQLNSAPFNNYMTATIVTVVDPYNFTININTTNYTAFTWPTIAQQPSSFPLVSPVGEDTASALLSNQPQVPLELNGQQVFNSNSGILADSTVNTGYLGMLLGAGGNGNVLGTPILGPSGSVSWSAGNVGTGDTIYWVAGKSSFGGL
jgi:hypothetical protein